MPSPLGLFFIRAQPVLLAFWIGEIPVLILLAEPWLSHRNLLLGDTRPCAAEKSTQQTGLLPTSKSGKFPPRCGYCSYNMATSKGNAVIDEKDSVVTMWLWEDRGSQSVMLAGMCCEFA